LHDFFSSLAVCIFFSKILYQKSGEKSVVYYKKIAGETTIIRVSQSAII